MIDIENKVYTAVKTALGTNAKCSKEYNPVTQELPLVTVYCLNNSIVEDFISSGGIENLAEITIEVNAYSNKDRGKLEECKKLIGIADQEISKMGIVRNFCSETPNYDSRIARMTARYICRVDKNYKISRR